MAKKCYTVICNHCRQTCKHNCNLSRIAEAALLEGRELTEAEARCNNCTDGNITQCTNGVSDQDGILKMDHPWDISWAQEQPIRMALAQKRTQAGNEHLPTLYPPTDEYPGGPYMAPEFHQQHNPQLLHLQQIIAENLEARTRRKLDDQSAQQRANAMRQNALCAKSHRGGYRNRGYGGFYQQTLAPQQYPHQNSGSAHNGQQVTGPNSGQMYDNGQNEMRNFGHGAEFAFNPAAAWGANIQGPNSGWYNPNANQGTANRYGPGPNINPGFGNANANAHGSESGNHTNEVPTKTQVEALMQRIRELEEAVPILESSSETALKKQRDKIAALEEEIRLRDIGLEDLERSSETALARQAVEMGKLRSKLEAASYAREHAEHSYLELNDKFHELESSILSGRTPPTREQSGNRSTSRHSHGGQGRPRNSRRRRKDKRDDRGDGEDGGNGGSSNRFYDGNVR